MLTRRRLFSAMAAFGAMLVLPFKARAAEIPPGELWAMPDLKLPKQGEKLYFIPVPSEEPNVERYLAQFMRRFTHGKNLEAGYEVEVRFYDKDGGTFGISEDGPRLHYYSYEGTPYEAVFLATVFSIETHLCSSGRGPETRTRSQFRNQLASVSVTLRSKKPSIHQSQGMYQVVRMRPRLRKPT